MKKLFHDIYTNNIDLFDMLKVGIDTSDMNLIINVRDSIKNNKMELP